MIKVDYAKCCWKNGGCGGSCCGSSKCEGCAEACPIGAIVRKDMIVVDNKKCISCGACVEACKNKAISLI